jgi:hypothetical protein
VKGIAIYVEGGGSGSLEQKALREGFQAFLGCLCSLARRKRLHWKVVPCGPRDKTLECFSVACRTRPDLFNVLLVDSDAPVNQPAEHLRRSTRIDLSTVTDEQLHLMVQVMETWLLADRDALVRYYKKGFRMSALPDSREPEEIPKAKVLSCLDDATRDTQKRRYHKIWHARDLLAQIDTQKVRAACRHCARLFGKVEQAIADTPGPTR